MTELQAKELITPILEHKHLLDLLKLAEELAKHEEDSYEVEFLKKLGRTEEKSYMISNESEFERICELQNNDNKFMELWHTRNNAQAAVRTAEKEYCKIILKQLVLSGAFTKEDAEATMKVLNNDYTSRKKFIDKANAIS